MATTSQEREQKRQERIKSDPEYRAQYLARKRKERQEHGKYPCQLQSGYEGRRKRQWRATNPDDNRRLRLAHRAVENALQTGKLIRPDVCQRCGKTCKPEAHHASYAKEDRLKVEWLCRLCHGSADVERRVA